MIRLTKAQARCFLLCKQGLLGKYRFVSKDGAYAYVRQAGCIQYDPVDVCGRNAELTLQSRVRGFTRQMLSDLLYRDRLLIDYADKELAIWPRDDWPYFASYRGKSKAHGLTFEGMPELEKRALAHIREHGPVSGDTLPIDGKVFWHSSMHWSGNWDKTSPAARSVLEQLYTDGVLIIHQKTGSRKVYDLASRHLPAELLAAANPCRDDDDFCRWRILRRIGGTGMLWNCRSDAWLGIEMSTEQREQAFRVLEAEGRITRTEVDNIRHPLYILTEDVPLMENVLSDNVDTTPRLEFLAPLDPLLWDRKLIEAVWNFRYSWEIYTPAEKRKFGYYVLPMLYGQAFIGRIEAVADRKTQTMTLSHVWFEPGVRQTSRLSTRIASAVRRLAKFNDCGRIVCDAESLIDFL